MKKQISIALTSLIITIAGILVGTPPSARASDKTIQQACEEASGTYTNGACSIPLCFQTVNSVVSRTSCLAANEARGIGPAANGQCYEITGFGTSFIGQGTTNCSTITEKFTNDTPARNCASSGGTWVMDGGTTDRPLMGCRCADGSTATGGVCSSSSNSDTRKAVIASEARDDCVATNLDASNCKIIEYINTVFNIVSAVIVLAVIGNIVYAGIRYSTSQGDPGGAGAAKKRIRDAVGAFIMYLLLYGFIQWLVPGGVF